MRDGSGRRHWAGEEGGGSAAGNTLTDPRPHHNGGSGPHAATRPKHSFLIPGTQTSLVYSQPPHRTAVSGSSPNGPPPGSPSRAL